MVDTRSDSYLKKLEEENRRLRVSLEELTILNDITRAISAAWSVDRIMELIVKKSIKHIKAEQGAVMLLDPKNEEKPFQTMIRRADITETTLPFRLDTQLIGWLLKYKKPLLSNDLENDERFKVDRTKDQPIRSVLSVPLLFKGRMIGSLNVFNKRTEEGFTDADKRLLSIIGTESAQVIESARLYEDEQALKVMQKEMKIAYKIQVGLLPQGAPDIPGYDIWGRSIPAKDVGGDYFDFIPREGARLGVCLGDVSGKGMPAALLVANIQAALRGYVLQGLCPEDCLGRSNEHLLTGMNLDRFVTLFYAMLDSKAHDLHYSNAGHNPPFLFRAGKEPRRLEVGGVALGCMGKAIYTAGRVTLDMGDILLVYSDGITEAIDRQEQLFGETRLAELVTANSGDTAERLVERIVEAVQQHAGELPQMDDMTAVVVKRCN
ncbi:MAG: GAF domain-containing SpoIIE family protein phosphatase [Candidatus Eisenbacteria bacterium]